MAGGGRKVVTGIRWAESNKRKSRRMVESCFSDETKIYLNVIIEWTNTEVWEYIKTTGIKYCSLYDEGFKRLGCIMCPMGNTRIMKLEAKRWTKYYRAYLRAFEKVIEIRRAKGSLRGWETGQDLMDWWINNPPKSDPDQSIIFE